MFDMFKSYDNEYLELYEYLTQHMGVKKEYAKEFLNAYKKNIGKLLVEGKAQLKALIDQQDPINRSLFSVSYSGYEYDFALINQAYQGYMIDLRNNSRYIGTSVEKMIWAILVYKIELTTALDKALGKWVENKWEDTFPHFFDEVFNENPFDDDFFSSEETHQTTDDYKAASSIASILDSVRQTQGLKELCKPDAAIVVDLDKNIFMKWSDNLSEEFDIWGYVYLDDLPEFNDYKSIFDFSGLESLPPKEAKVLSDEIANSLRYRATDTLALAVLRAIKMQIGSF
jgi:hypothetical protein